jgi:hypothetical protein
MQQQVSSIVMVPGVGWGYNKRNYLMHVFTWGKMTQVSDVAPGHLALKISV